MFFQLKGGSSGNITILKISEEDLNTNLLDFLRKSAQPIASSCRGEMVCKLCALGDESILSCSFTVKSYMEKHGNTIYVPYL